MSKQTILLVLTCINIVKCISDSVQAFKEVVVVDPLCVGTHPVLVSSYLEGWIHLLHSHSCGVALHFLLSQKIQAIPCILLENTTWNIRKRKLEK